MDSRNIDLSLSSTDEAGKTTSFHAAFDGVTLPWSELNAVFNAAATQIRDLTHVAPTKSQGMASPMPKLVAELNIDAGTSFVDESHPHAEALRRSFGEQQQGPASQAPEAVRSFWAHLKDFSEPVPAADAPAKDYGVHSMTPGEVQRLLESKDRMIAGLELDKEKLVSNLDVARQERDNLDDLRREAYRQADASEAESQSLRKAIVGLQADVRIRRQNVEDLTKQRDHLQHRNQNQERSLKEFRAKLDLYEAGAPGVAELNRKYEELMQHVSNAADEDTRLQDERDIARKERDRAIKDYNDLLAVHEDQTERLNASQRELRAAQLETKEYERRCDLKDAKARAAANERNREQERVENYERRLSQVKTTAQSVEEMIQADTGALSSEMIHKSDALKAVKTITETIGKPFPEVL